MLKTSLLHLLVGHWHHKRQSSWLLNVILKKPNTYNNVKCYGSDTQTWPLALLYLGTLHRNASVSEKGVKC